jgi:uncharacterized membrane protein YecN with MAPEG domain
MNLVITAASIAVCAILLAVLALRVSILRTKFKVALGDGGRPELLRAIRAHGNNIEHIPIFLLTSLGYEALAGSTTTLALLDTLFVVARVLLALGLSRSAINLLRRVGAISTLFCELVLAGMLLWTVVARVL